jgi:hypothetical protein
MAEVEFERRVERLFGEAPELADAPAFAERLERRLDRGWRRRHGLIGAAGVAGGLIGASQLLVSGVFHRVEAAGASARAVSAGLARAAPAQWLSQLPAGGAVVWAAAAVALLLLGFVLSRVIEEI